ncbi:PAS domain S-box protein [Marinimicrobium locisalis]|uniref:PAS domain S-box protein n=1 Tax=Marinimicrobium locisalis TaxID=546022 RepID=UPI003221EC1B
MREPELPWNEEERLKTLHDLGILDTPDEERFDRLTRIAKYVFGVDMAVVSLIDEERQWFKSRQGLDACQTNRSISFCGHAILSDDILEIPDAWEDDRFQGNPLVVGPPHIRFYAGAPLKVGLGVRVGTLCIIDREPRTLSGEERRVLRDLADTVEQELQRFLNRLLGDEAVSRGSDDGEAVLEAFPDTAFVVDRQGTVLSSSGQRPLFGADIVGHPLSSFLPPDAAASIQQMVTRAVYGNEVISREVVLASDSDNAIYEVRVRPLSDLKIVVLMGEVTAERKRAKALEESQARLAWVLEGTRTGTWEWNVQTGATVFNERWAEIVGYRLEELEPVDINTWLNLAHPDDLKDSADLLDRHFRGALPEYDCRCRMRHKDGHWVWVHDRGRVMSWTEAGEPLMMYGTHSDITREMEAQGEREHQIQALTTLNDIASNPTLSVSEQVERALELGTRFLELEVGIVSEIFEDLYRISWFTAPSGSGLETHQTFDLGQTYCSLTLDAGDVLAIEDMGNSPYRGHPCYQSFALESYIGAAIEAGGRRYGTLNFSSPHVRSSPFRESDRMFVRLLARWVGAAIDRYEGKQRLAKLATQFPGMMYQFQRSPDGRSSFPFCSPGVKDIYGLTPEEIEEDAGAVFNVIHPDDLAHVQTTIEASAKNMSVWHVQYRVRREDGGYRWVEGNSTPERLADGSIVWHGTIHDISEQKRAQEALLESEARLRALFELSPIGIALNDFETGEFLEVNKALAQSAGYGREEFLTLNYWALTPREYEEKELEQLESLRERGQYGPYEKEYIRRDGERYPVMLNGTLVEDPTGRRLIWSIIEDISERKRIERLKNEFVSTVSHELRTPLTSISGALGLALNGGLGELTDATKNMLTIAHKNSQRLTDLINDLLDMEKLVSGNMELDVKPCRLRELVAQSIDNIQGYADKYRVHLSLSAPADDPTVNVDAQRFEQVMANLLSNAIKFSPAGGTVTVSIERQSDGVRVGVRDCGAGIPESFRTRLFQKFAQVDASDSRQRGGTGLGLAITRELVEQMKGRVDYQSKPGEGAFFYVDLPSPEATATAPQPLNGKVLVVEDDAETAGYLKALLERQGSQVDVACTGEQALDLLCERSYDLATIDLMLPGMHGLELIRQIRTIPKLQRLALVVVTAEVAEGEVSLNQYFPNVTWVAKPINEEACHQLGQALSARGRSEKPHVLHVEDDVDLHNVLGTLVGSASEFEHARTVGEALSLLESRHYDVIIIDILLPDGNGLELVETARKMLPQARIVVMTGTDVGDDLKHTVDRVIQKSELSLQELLKVIETSWEGHGTGQQ